MWNSRLILRMVFLAALMVTAAGASAADYPVSWTFGGSFPDLNILENDTVTFTYTTSHNVYEFVDETAFMNCDFAGSALVGGSSDSPLTVDFTGGTRFFGCAVGSHCASGGMKLKVTAQAAAVFSDGFEGGTTDGWDLVVE